MNTAKHIIIDIETLGRRNDAAVTQVGIVIADETFSVLDKYLIQVSPEAWNTCNRTFTGETLLWWMEQKNSPISNIGNSSAYSSYYTAMSALNGIFKRYNTDDTIIIPKGATYCLNRYGEVVSDKLMYTGNHIEITSDKIYNSKELWKEK